MHNDTYLNWVISEHKDKLVARLGRHGRAGFRPRARRCRRHLQSVPVQPGDRQVAARRATGDRGGDRQGAAGRTEGRSPDADRRHPWRQDVAAGVRASSGNRGYVCAQVNPSRTGDREAMLAMARRFHAWAPNITVKLPGTPGGPRRRGRVHRGRHLHHDHGQLHGSAGAGRRRTAPQGPARGPRPRASSRSSASRSS